MITFLGAFLLVVLLMVFTVLLTAVRYNLCKNSPCKALRETGICPFADQYGLPARNCDGCPYMNKGNDDD